MECVYALVRVYSYGTTNKHFRTHRAHCFSHFFIRLLLTIRSMCTALDAVCVSVCMSVCVCACEKFHLFHQYIQNFFVCIVVVFNIITSSSLRSHVCVLCVFKSSWIVILVGRSGYKFALVFNLICFHL